MLAGERSILLRLRLRLEFGHFHSVTLGGLSGRQTGWRTLRSPQRETREQRRKFLKRS